MKDFGLCPLAELEKRSKFSGNLGFGVGLGAIATL